MMMVASQMGRLLGVLLVGTLFACTDGEESHLWYSFP